jgi:hypothetical protein
MAAKPAKTSTRSLNKQTAPAPESDPTRYTAINLAGARIYHGAGVVLAEAVRIAEGLLAPTAIARVEDNGQLTPGLVTREANERLVFATA